jgi:TolA-binding protein
MKKLAWGAGIVILLAVAASIAWYMAQPHTAAEQLEQARKVEASNAARIAALRSNPTPENRRAADDLLAQSLAEYSRVGAAYPGTTETMEADYRAYQIRDENSTDTRARIALAEEFLKRHPNSPHAADLRWRIAAATHQELKAHLDAIKLYEKFAADFHDDERAAEALFRVGGIYEQIREFGSATRAYQRVAAEFPKSKFADEAQFRNGNLLAEKMEKKKEAAEAFAKVEKSSPGSRLAGAAGSARKRIEQEETKKEAGKYRDDYYGVPEVDPVHRFAEKFDSPLMKRLRAQQADLLHQDIRAELDPEAHQLTATATMSLAATAETSGAFLMQLDADMQVRSVRRGGAEARFDRQEDFILVDLGDAPLKPGGEESFEVAYGAAGNPVIGGDIITTQSTYLTWLHWLPLLRFGDNFTADVAVTVPKGCTAIALGEPSGRDDDGSATLFRFSQRQPVLLHMLVAAPYAVREGSYASRGAEDGGAQRKIPLVVCLFESTDKAYFDAYLRELPPILDFFEQKLGPFPYPRQVVAQVDHFPGGMCAAGLIILGRRAFDKPGAPASFLAHEVAHAWFGNHVTIDLEGDSVPWLAEGFAQYWDALYLEQREGKERFVRHMRELAERYYSMLGSAKDKPIIETLMGDPVYAPLAYDKGAFVLHALRGVLGDAAFFGAMRAYVEAHGGGTTRVADFRAAAEKAHGAPLDWFFDEWIAKAGMPRYRVNLVEQTTSTVATATAAVKVEVEQVGAVFRMPVDIEVETRGGKERHRVEIADAFTTVTLPLKADPVKVVLDPDYWILKHPRNAEWEKPVAGGGSEPR